MQLVFDFGMSDAVKTAWRSLAAAFGPSDMGPARTPVGQLVKSLISNRTYDAVSLAAYERLIARWSWAEMAAASVAEIQALIAPVEYPEVKAPHLRETLRRIQAERPDFNLAFLGDLPEDEAFAWLERLPGVGCKVAASVLNFSTLGRQALVIDTHVQRILRRCGLIGPRTSASAAYDRVIGALADWSAADLTDLHVQMKRLGQTVCRPQRPSCATCPLADTCRWPPPGGVAPV